MSVDRAGFGPVSRRRLATALVVAFSSCQIAGFSSLARAQSDDCANVIEASLTSYQEGRFDRAIGALDQCLRHEGISEDRRGEAYRILGLCYLAKDDEDRAKIAIHQLLLLVPAWQPHPLDDPPAFHRLVAEVRTAMSEGRLVSSADASAGKSKGKKSWWILGSLAAAGGALAVVLLSGVDKDPIEGPDLPAPPALPED